MLALAAFDRSQPVCGSHHHAAVPLINESSHLTQKLHSTSFLETFFFSFSSSLSMQDWLLSFHLFLLFLFCVCVRRESNFRWVLNRKACAAQFHLWVERAPCWMFRFFPRLQCFYCDKHLGVKSSLPFKPSHFRTNGFSSKTCFCTLDQMQTNLKIRLIVQRGSEESNLCFKF